MADYRAPLADLDFALRTSGGLEGLHALRGTAHIKDLRNLGIIAGIELEPRSGEPGKRGYEAFTKAWEKGLLIRVTGDIIALSPPLILDEHHIDRMMQTLKETLEAVA